MGAHLLQVAFPSLKELELQGLRGINEIWGNQYGDHVSSSFCKLESLTVKTCNKLETVISLSMLHRLQNLENIVIRLCLSLRNSFVSSIARDVVHLKKMYVSHCSKMSEIIGAGKQDEEITDSIVFPELTVLELRSLSNLTSFGCCDNGEANTYKVYLFFAKLNQQYLRFNLSFLNTNIK